MVSGSVYAFRRSGAVRYSSTLLALMLAVTLVGLIPAVWILLWAWGRVEIDDAGIRYRPVGGTMDWAEVDRFGMGCKTGRIDPDDPLGLTTYHLLLRSTAGRTLAVNPLSFAESTALLTEVKRRVGRKPEELKVSFLFQRLSFRD
jgi:hypothetical protein